MRSACLLVQEMEINMHSIEMKKVKSVPIPNLEETFQLNSTDALYEAWRVN